MQNSLTPIQNGDAYFMNLAIAEAKKCSFATRPNPTVGCVIVKNGLIIGSGFHPKAGLPHAEVYALNDAKERGESLVGATAYVTLEPCSHTGRTPPCADTLVASGISRVVIACRDPNPKVAGRGIQKLLDAGILVSVGVCEREARALNVGFLKSMECGLPYVRLKIAMSLDGRIAMHDGESKWITSDESRTDVQRLRAKSGAIVTGSGTIMADNPSLNVRLPSLNLPKIGIIDIPQPKIVVLDRSNRLQNSDDYRVFNDVNTLIWRKEPVELLMTLAQQYQCHDVLVEAGAKVAGAFIEQGLVDELIVYQAPCILGANAITAFDFSIDRLCQQKRFVLNDIERIGGDVKLTFVRA